MSLAIGKVPKQPAVAGSMLREHVDSYAWVHQASVLEVEQFSHPLRN